MVPFSDTIWSRREIVSTSDNVHKGNGSCKWYDIKLKENDSN